MKGDTPSSDRLHIAFIGRRNAGKSSVVNMLCGQDVSIVSDVPGTTTDPVRKAIELPGLGPCVLIDTAGLDDEGMLGGMRSSASMRIIAESDIVVLVLPTADIGGLAFERDIAGLVRGRGIPLSILLNSRGQIPGEAVFEGIVKAFGEAPVVVDAASGLGRESLLEALLEKVPQDFGSRSLLGDMVGEGDVVVLVMPQDSEAPKGRLIMPQSMVIRELLEKGCISINCIPETFARTLGGLKSAPDLVIADSSVFGRVAPYVPEGTRLTSFSILMAGYKGDLEYFVRSAGTIGQLEPWSRILIAESCSHVPDGEDIGRVRIPALLSKTVAARCGREHLQIDTVSGRDFPQELGNYALVVHCGGCVFSRRHLMARVEEAKKQGVPMTNYGIALAYLTGILGRVSLPGATCASRP